MSNNFFIVDEFKPNDIFKFWNSTNKVKEVVNENHVVTVTTQDGPTFIWCEGSKLPNFFTVIRDDETIFSGEKQ